MQKQHNIFNKTEEQKHALDNNHFHPSRWQKATFTQHYLQIIELDMGSLCELWSISYVRFRKNKPFK